MGGDAPNGEWTDVITLSFNRHTFALNVGGQCDNMDILHAMLDQATRFVDEQLRLAGVARMQKLIQEQQRTAAILDSIGKSARA